MPVAAYATTVKVVKQGTGTVFTDEATIGGTGPHTFKINDRTKAIWDPSVAIVVKDGFSVLDAANIVSFDYLFGQVTLVASYTVGFYITVSGSYLTPLAVANSKEFDLSLAATMLETTVFGTAGYKTRKTGLLDASGSLTGLDPAVTDIDPGGGTLQFSAAIAAATPLLLEVRPGGAGQYFRGWVLIEGADEKAAATGLLEASYKWVSAPPKSGAAFAFGT